jgi:hypothetical protein
MRMAVVSASVHKATKSPTSARRSSARMRDQLLHGGGHRLPLRVAEILYRARARSSDPAGEPSRCAELVVAVYLADPTRPDAATRDVGAVQHLGVHVVMRAAAARPPPVTFVATTLSPLQLSRIPHVYMTVYQCVAAAQQARL